ncbi:MAG: zinc-binding dehydrogenase [Anaerolineae bacterium]|nr:zinc-binding dehydrogenase [Anaerolineae bacterium]
MKKAVILGEREAAIVEVPCPQPKADWALVKVHASAMCTEYKAFLSGRQRDSIGHEGAGEVVAVAQPGPVKLGDRVVILPQYPDGTCPLCLAGDYTYCENSYDYAGFMGTPEGSGTFAQYVVKPSWLLPAIPDGVSYEHATMAIDGIGATFGAFQAIGVSAFDTVLITGLGPVGLGGVVNARYRGARVIGVEPVPWRAELARRMGAEAVLDPRHGDLLARVMALTGGCGVDCAVDCSGNVAAERLCIDATRRRGRVAFVGECNEELAIRISPDLIRKGLTIVGSWLCNRGDYPLVMKVIRESPLMDLLVSHVMPMSRIQEAFELLASGQCAKVVLRPWE